MDEGRTGIFRWIAQGQVPPDNVPAALRLVGVTPGADDWRHFLDRLFLWLGVVFCAAAVIFFFAYNWQDLGRYARFGLVEVPLLLGLLLCWRLGVESAAGKAVLLLLTLLTGALLALVGQTYQTGADTFELFAVWAFAALPWVLVGRFSALWLVWLALLNIAALLYMKTFGSFFGGYFAFEENLWLLLTLNGTALALREFAAWRGADWLRERWSARVIAVVVVSLLAMLVLNDILGRREMFWAFSLPAYAVWLLVAGLWYRRVQPDLFVLACNVLSVIVTITAALVRAMDRFDAGGALFVGLVVIALAALGSFWLRRVARELRA